MISLDLLAKPHCIAVSAVLCLGRTIPVAHACWPLVNTSGEHPSWDWRWAGDAMELASPLPLTDAGTPKMRDEEIVRRAQPGVDLYDRAKKSQFKGGVIHVTTHRLLWLDPARRHPMYWELSKVGRRLRVPGCVCAFPVPLTTRTRHHFIDHLPQVTSVSAHSGFGAFSHPKINVHFQGAGDPYIRLSFHSGGKSDT